MSVIGSNIIAGASGTVEAGYQIARSLRFNSADSAYFNKTFASAGNRQKWVYSIWIKPSSVSSVIPFIESYYDVNNMYGIRLNSSGNLQVYDWDANAYRANLVSSSVYRDPSAFYHFLIAWDTTQATAANRIKAFVNGVQLTAFSTATYPTQNLNGGINSGSLYAHRLGRSEFGGSIIYANSIEADMQFVDGYAPATTTRTVNGVTETILTDFGEFDAATGVWVPKAYAGTYGTNGFWLKFDDNSGTTATTLGKDSSGNGNNWTPNNFSVTAGTGNDSLVDSPTNYGTDTGAGGEVRGNYATWNPLDSAGTPSNGNLLGDTGSTGSKTCVATMAMQSGKYYWEVQYTSGSGSDLLVGIAGDTFSGKGSVVLSNSAVGWSINSFNGNLLNNGSSTAYGVSFTTNDIISVAYDADTGKVWFAKNGTWMNSGNPATGANPATSSATAPMRPAICSGTSTTQTANTNFGQRPFAYTAPSGFKALCTQNLPTPAIGASASTLASKNFNIVTYTGTGSSLSVTGVGFQPDLVWIKGRSGATDHALYDAVRGVQKQLESNTTTDETTETTGLTAFGTDGFTVGALAQLNTSSATYVGWNWKESATSGFDIVTYTGNGANRTISHGLGVAPKMVIVKARTTAGTDTGWPVWHTGIANTNYIDLNGSAASTSGTTYWNSTSPTSSVFSVGTAAAVNTNNDTYVAYLFAEVEGFSKFGSYTGNGSTDGVFLYCGFSPRYVMVKQTDAVGNWIIWDTARSTFNQSQKYVVTNGTAAAEGDLAAVAIDILSNGFKCRTTDNDINGSTNTYIFAAFSEAPFNYSRAR